MLSNVFNFPLKWSLDENNVTDELRTGKPWQPSTLSISLACSAKFLHQLLVFAITPTKLITASAGLSPMLCIYPWDADQHVAHVLDVHRRAAPQDSSARDNSADSHFFMVAGM